MLHDLKEKSEDIRLALNMIKTKDLFKSSSQQKEGIQL